MARTVMALHLRQIETLRCQTKPKRHVVLHLQEAAFLYAGTLCIQYIIPLWYVARNQNDKEASRRVQYRSQQ